MYGLTDPWLQWLQWLRESPRTDYARTGGLHGGCIGCGSQIKLYTHRGTGGCSDCGGCRGCASHRDMLIKGDKKNKNSSHFTWG